MEYENENPAPIQSRKIISPLYEIALLKSMREDKWLFYSTKNQCPATFSPSVYVWSCTYVRNVHCILYKSIYNLASKTLENYEQFVFDTVNVSYNFLCLLREPVYLIPMLFSK